MSEKEAEAGLVSVDLQEETSEQEKGRLIMEQPTTSGATADAGVPESEMAKPPPPAEEGDEADACAGVLMVLSLIGIVLFFPFSLICALKMVQEYERAVIFRVGRILHGGAKGPGLFFVYPCMDTVVTVDLRTKSLDIQRQDILTKDHVTVTVDAVMYLSVVNPILCVTKVEDYVGSSRILGATTLRSVLGTYNMNEILSKRDIINTTMKELLDAATDPWGVNVERVELTDVMLPDSLQRAMAAEAEATREARAKVIAADGEQKAAKSLSEAAQVMAETPAALQLRYLQTLNTIAAEKNSTIIFPLPMELLQAFKPQQDLRVHRPVSSE